MMNLTNIWNELVGVVMTAIVNVAIANMNTHKKPLYTKNLITMNTSITKRLGLGTCEEAFFSGVVTF